MSDRSTPHPLSSLFAPSSIAILGASERPGRPGFQVVETLRRVDPDRNIFPITPRYEEISGIPCFPTIDAAPAVDLVVIASGTQRIESEIEVAVEHGAGGIVVFGAPKAGPERDMWMDRIRDQTREAGVPLLGPDSLGFIDYVNRCGATWAFPDQLEAGGIAILSQSGTVYWEAITNDPRLRFSFSAHSGLESTLTIADLMGYSLSLGPTRVIGLYIETIRDPEGFAQVLAAAAERDVAVVAMYAGRSERSRAQMMTHAGRLSGDRAALEGIFRHYGVARVESSDEWWTTLALLGSDRRLGPGGLAAVMDSGGGLAMFHDFAEDLKIPLAQLHPETKRKIADMLGFEGEIGPGIDFWIGDRDRHAQTEELIGILAADDATAAVLSFTTYAECPGAGFADNVGEASLRAAAVTDKPVLAATYTSRQLHTDLMLRLARSGLPILDGMWPAMLAIRHAFDHRAFRSLLSDRSDALTAETDLEEATISSWKDRLAGRSRLWEADALAFLSDMGVPCVQTLQADTEDEAAAAAARLGFPAVLKTDEEVAHKAARDGVHLSLRDEGAVRSAYRRLVEDIGPRVLVAPMIGGIEVAIGVVAGQFGPTVMVGGGGTLIEILSDHCYLLAPAAPEEVKLAMDDLLVTRIIRATFGKGSSAERQLHELASRVSVLASVFAGTVSELDINPVLVSDDGCIAVDALVGLAPASEISSDMKRG